MERYRRMLDRCLLPSGISAHKCSRVNGGDLLGPEAPIYAKIGLVGGDNRRLREEFGQNDNRCISRVHIWILDHQFLGSFQVFGPRVKKLDGSLPDKREQGVGRP